jgi:hypothetical protein
MPNQVGEPLLAISIDSIQNASYVDSDGHMAKTANIRAVSAKRELCFRTTTGLLNQEQVRRCELLKQHGCTVVEAPKNWQYNGGWQGVVIKQAIEQVAMLYEGKEETERMSAYDPELADTILLKLNENFTVALSDHQLKHALVPEPSDDALLTALEGLKIDGLVDGIGMKESTTGRRSLTAMANIRITGEGRKHLSGATQKASGTNGPVIHNFGQIGSVGSNSQGTVNVNNAWKNIAAEIDLQQLGAELERVRTAYRTEAPPTRENDKQIALLADAAEYAENGDGQAVTSTLSRLSTGVLTFAKGLGVELLPKVIAELIKSQ